MKHQSHQVSFSESLPTEQEHLSPLHFNKGCTLYVERKDYNAPRLAQEREPQICTFLLYSFMKYLVWLTCNTVASQEFFLPHSTLTAEDDGGQTHKTRSSQLFYL